MRHISFHALLWIFALSAAPASADELTDADKLLKRGQTEQALQKVGERIAAKPQDVQARFMQGVILTELGRNEEAKAVFRQLTVEFPEVAEPYNNLAVLYAAGGDFDNARATLETAVRINPRYATAHENLGDIYAQLANMAYANATAAGANSAGLRGKLKLARDLTLASTPPPNPQP